MWKNTRNHAICSRHFVDWNQGPTQAHPDPELFGYNNWGKNQYIRRSIYKRQRVKHAPPETSTSQAASDKTEAITESSQETLAVQLQDEECHLNYLGYDQGIQATVEVSSSSADTVPHVPPITSATQTISMPHEDHSYVTSRSAIQIEPVDASVQVEVSAFAGSNVDCKSCNLNFNL
ncbi:hypothetical protein Pcinc_031726 [Petrolisthes cinctipes]|uniref:THAP-type domain-containing protein n=1 Tax=Petrolisthes cinctipes TaxID=88211 RepID=A0AAE1EW40_PETCI|nr:hypothetical protein Pcinc_031726 [Petrolisthes cinctipes]